jgi:hypothetical protein
MLPEVNQQQGSCLALFPPLLHKALENLNKEGML